MTRGKLSASLKSVANIPTWNDFSIGRIRKATDISLPTSGHVVSHNQAELRARLENEDLSNILVIDDTSFSGNTSLIVEKLLRTAFPEKTLNFTHGFLILNQGNLGPNPGAKTNLEKVGSKAIGGMRMETPTDDGWHFFDLANQENIEDHLNLVFEILKLVGQANFEQMASVLLSSQDNLRIMFPRLVTSEALSDLRESGHFVSKSKPQAGFHVRNPQLLPNIIGQKHLSPVNDWLGEPEEAFAFLISLNKLLKKGTNEK